MSKKKNKGKVKNNPSLHSNIVQKLIGLLVSSGASVGVPSHHVHQSMTQYVSKYVNDISVIDISTTCRNMLSLYKLISLLMERKHTIRIVANSADHSRIGSKVFRSMPSNVHVLSKRWSPGMFSNFGRFSAIVHVYKRMSVKNKSKTMKRQYASKYGPIEKFYLNGKIPRLIIFMDIVGIDTARSEAQSLGIPTVGFVNIDYKKSDMLTYVIPVGYSVRSIALLITVLRRFIIKPIKSGAPLSVVEQDVKLGYTGSRRVWYGKMKWKNTIVPVAHSNIVTKYIEWDKRRKARKVNSVY
jgi:ribosomal protein S2